MFSLLLLGLSSFLLALSLTPLVRFVARRFGIVDHGDDKRRIHVGDVPRLGGLAVILAFIGSYAVLFVSGLAGTGVARKVLPGTLEVTATVVMFSTGLIDDIWGLRP